MSQRKIADELGISRNTVPSYIKEYDSLSATLFTSENLSKEQLRVLAEQIAKAPRYHVQNRHNRKYTEEIDCALDSILAEEETKTKALGSSSNFGVNSFPPLYLLFLYAASN